MFLLNIIITIILESVGASTIGMGKSNLLPILGPGGMQGYPNSIPVNKLEKVCDEIGNKKQSVDGIVVSDSTSVAPLINRANAQSCKYSQAKEVAKHYNDMAKQFKKFSDQLLGGRDNAKGKCTYKLSEMASLCFAQNAVQNALVVPVWNVMFHSNVAELWYRNKPLMMVVLENLKFLRKPRTTVCSYFKTTDFKTQQNMFGNVISVTGRPNVSKTQSCLSKCLSSGPNSIKVEGASVCGECHQNSTMDKLFDVSRNLIVADDEKDGSEEKSKKDGASISSNSNK